MSVPCGKQTPSGPCQRRVSRPHGDCGVDHSVIDLSDRPGRLKMSGLAAQAAQLDEASMAAAYDEAAAGQAAESLIAGKSVRELAHLASADPDPEVRRAATRLLMQGNERGTAKLMAAIFSEPNAA